MPRRVILIIGVVIIFAVLTTVTQLGGIVFLLALLVAWCLRRLGLARPAAILAALVFFLAAVPILNRYVVPPLAAFGGREPLPCTATAEHPYAARSPIYCVLGRNYVRTRTKSMLDAMAGDLAKTYPGLVIATLDAGYPFIDGFPLPPHLSHDDGRRIDLAYFYKDGFGNAVPLTTPSPLGYWGFEVLRQGETSPCDDKVRWLTLRWDMGWFRPFLRQDLMLDEERTAGLLRWLVEQGPAHGVKKVLLEPHMAKRLQVTSPLIRFQGCRTARHDDHIHVEVAAEL